MVADVGMSLLGETPGKLKFAPTPSLSADQISNIESQLDRVQALDPGIINNLTRIEELPDVLILCSFPNNGFQIVRAVKERNYNPKAIIVTPFLVGTLFLYAV